MERNYVHSQLVSALETLIYNDTRLLQFEANERSITHRLALYLEGRFSDWDVDCEYNRLETDPKRLREIENMFGDEDLSPRDTNARSVFPDIIVHQRGEQDNLLAIEVKKTTWTQGYETDWEKLQQYRLDPALRYDFACLVIIGVLDRSGEYEIRFVESDL